MGDELIFVCLGDSLTAGTPGFSGYGTWSGDITSQYEYWLDLLVKRNFPSIPAEFLNYGVGGDVVKQILVRFQRDVLTQLDKVDYVLLMGGNNDVVWRGLTPRQCLDDYTQLCKVILKSKAKIIGLEILPVTIDLLLVNKIKETNRGIHRLGEKMKFSVVSLHDALANRTMDGLEKLYDSGDGEHLSVAGYKKVGEIIFSALIKDILFK